MKRYDKHYYDACQSYMSMHNQDIITRQLRCENIIMISETMVKVGFVFFFAAIFWSLRLALAYEFSATSWSFYIILMYAGIYWYCNRSLIRRRAYSDAAEVMLYLQDEESRQRYVNEKLRPRME